MRNSINAFNSISLRRSLLIRSTALAVLAGLLSLAPGVMTASNADAPVVPVQDLPPIASSFQELNGDVALLPSSGSLDDTVGANGIVANVVFKKGQTYWATIASTNINDFNNGNIYLTYPIYVKLLDASLQPVGDSIPLPFDIYEVATVNDDGSRTSARTGTPFSINYLPLALTPIASALQDSETGDLTVSAGPDGLDKPTDELSGAGIVNVIAFHDPITDQTYAYYTNRETPTKLTNNFGDVVLTFPISATLLDNNGDPVVDNNGDPVGNVPLPINRRYEVLTANFSSGRTSGVVPNTQRFNFLYHGITPIQPAAPVVTANDVTNAITGLDLTTMEYRLNFVEDESATWTNAADPDLSGDVVVEVRIIDDTFNGSGLSTTLYFHSAPESPAAAVGHLDPTFGAEGIVRARFDAFRPSLNSSATSMKIDSAGKIVVGGYSYKGFEGTRTTDFALARYTSSGVLDATFGTAGTQTTSVGGAALPNGAINSIVIDSTTGKIVAGGYSKNIDGGYDFTLARYTASGVLDTTFNSAGATPGIQITTVGTSQLANSYISSVAIDSTGNIVAGGSANNSDGGYDFALVRYTSTGVLDTTFNPEGATPGIQITPVGSNALPRAAIYSIAIDSADKIVAGGFAKNINGGLEFGNDFALARYTSTGVLDTTFNPEGATPGIQITPVGTAAPGDANSGINSIAIDGAGKIVAGGYSKYSEGTGYDFALARYTSAGVLDPTFNAAGETPGIQITAVGTAQVHDEYGNIYSIAIDSVGKIVAGGYSKNSEGGYDSTFVRYTTSGVLDLTFNTTGIQITPVGSAQPSAARSFIYSMAINSAGNIVAGGSSMNSDGREAFTLMRYLSTIPVSNPDGGGGAGGGGFIATPVISSASTTTPVTQAIIAATGGTLTAQIPGVGSAAATTLTVVAPAGATTQNFTLSLLLASNGSDTTPGHTAIKLTAATTTGGTAVTTFEKPLAITLPAGAAGSVSAWSIDGFSWSTLPLLTSASLPAGQADGYFINADGTYTLFTRHLTFFGFRKAQAAHTTTSSATTLSVAKTAQLTSAGGSGSGTVNYSTTTPLVCSVSSSGLVTALAAGTCTLNSQKLASGIYLDAKSAAVNITVSALKALVAKNIGATKVKFTIALGMKYANKSVTLTSSAGKKLATIKLNESGSGSKTIAVNKSKVSKVDLKSGTKKLGSVNVQ